MRGKTSEEGLGAFTAEEMGECFCRREGNETEAR
jgi:hypothetical protein